MIIGILDYGVSNIKSISRAILTIGYDYKIIKSKKDFNKIDILILPGVGTFSSAMEKIHSNDFYHSIIEHAKTKKVIGICLGMQLLAEESDEIKLTSGLNLIPGKIIKIENFYNKVFRKIPNIGWRKIFLNNNEIKFAKNFNSNEFYFVHSYRFQCDDKYILFNTNYHDEQIPAIVKRHNIIGLQFHPEKSRESGLSLLRYTLENL
jgi:glutamine amidotransferase